MDDCVIESLHQGMNLRDPAAVIAPGETGMSLGCDFHIPGQVTPMNEGLLTWTMATDVQDFKILYLQDVRYLFYTMNTGLYVSSTATGTMQLDAVFTGNFKALSLNDEYVVFSNGPLRRKWKPTWTTAYQWGLNTPDTPTVAAGTSLEKVIDGFESLTPWSFTGGGAAGNLQADLVHNRGSGTQSMRLTATAQTTIIASRLITLNLSQFNVAGDAGVKPYLQLSFYTDELAAIQSILLKFSCAVGGAFTKDYYRVSLALGGNVYVTLAPTGAQEASGTYDAILSGEESPDVPTPIYYNKLDDSKLTPQYALQPDGTYRLMSTDELAAASQTIVIQPRKRNIDAGPMTWTDVKIPLSKFARIGDTPGRDWATITALAIEVEASGVDCDISFDDWKMVGGGNLDGDYWVAIAYQNELGNYGPFTPFVGPVTLNAQPLAITGLVPDTDPQTVKYRLALIGGGLTQPMVAYIEDKTATSYSLNEIESSLTTMETKFNNHPPPTGIVDMRETNGRIFLVAGTNQLIYSEDLFYEGFPLKNYLTLIGGERLYQLGLFPDGFVAARGRGREYITHINSSTPTFWRVFLGATQGAVSSRLCLEDPSGVQVFMSERGFYASSMGGTRGEYLEKINPAIANYAQAFGDMIPDRAYIYFQDTAAVHRVMRIDYRLGRPIAHYVANMQPTAICADNIANKVYYAIGPKIYEFDAGTSRLAATLTIPGQFCGSIKLKTFESLLYELEGESLGLALVLDRITQPNNYTLGAATRETTPTSLPHLTGAHLGLILTSEAGKDFTLYLPWILDVGAVQ
jgi:hypothetical protein